MFSLAIIIHVGEELQHGRARELEILKLVSEGFSYPAIAENLFIAPATVKKHVANIFEKLHVTNKINALKKTEGLF